MDDYPEHYCPSCLCGTDDESLSRNFVRAWLVELNKEVCDDNESNADLPGRFDAWLAKNKAEVETMLRENTDSEGNWIIQEQSNGNSY